MVAARTNGTARVDQGPVFAYSFAALLELHESIMAESV